MIAPNILFFILIICLNLGLIAYYYKHFKLLRFQQKILETENLKHLKILNFMPFAWAYWYDGDSLVQCSNAFRHLLRIDEDYPVHVNDILKILGDSSFCPFHRALNHLSDFGGEFTLQISIFDQTHTVEIHGFTISQSPFTSLSDSSFLSPLKPLIILTLTDITKAIEEKNKVQHREIKRNNALEILNNLTEVLPIALWARDFQGRINYCNSTYASALETSVPRVLAENKELIDNYQSFNTYDLSKKALNTGSKQSLRTHIVISGQRHYVEISEVPISSSNIMIGYAIDLTEIEKTENERIKYINAYQEILHQISSPFIMYDADTNVEFFNHAYLKQFELDEAWLYSKPSIGEVLEELRQKRKLPEHSNFPAYKRENLNLFKNLLQPVQELVHLSDGKILRMMTAPTPFGGLLFLFDDVTDKLALEQGYNTLIAVQKETIDHLYEGVIVFGSDNRVRLSNPALEIIWNLSEYNQILNSHINEFLENISNLFESTEANNNWRQKILNIVSLRQSIKGDVFLKDNRRIEYAYVPLPDGSHLISFMDASDRWRFEQTLKERTDALERTDKLKSDFISLVSYELKSPLQTIKGFIDILFNQYFGSLNERQLDYCRGILEASDRLMKLINDMLALASIEAGNLTLEYQEVSLEDFINSITELVHDRIHDQGLELLIEKKCRFKNIFIDPHRMKHALFNLLTNAIKYTPRGGKISFIISDDSNLKDHFNFIITDTGVGISLEGQKKVFSFFEATVNNDDHVGPSIGLPLVKNLIELHKGTIKIESEIGVGTSVICCLPYK